MHALTIPQSETPAAVFPGRLAIRQRVLTDYRARLFDLVAPLCTQGLKVLAGEPPSSQAIKTADTLQVAQRTMATNRQLFSGKVHLLWQPELIGWLEENNPDVLVTDSNPRLLDTARAIRWMHDRNRAVIGWGLGTMQLSAGLESLRDAFRRRHIRRFDGLIAYSEAAAEQYAAVGFPAKRIYVAHNAAIPAPRGDCPPRAPEFVGAPKMVFIGRLIEGKRLEDLLQACSQLGALQPELLIVGDGPLRQQYEQAAAQLYPNTRFLGARHGEAVAEICREADLFVLPGKGGLAIQEAMCFGLPVVATSADGTEQDLVRPGNGWLFEEGKVGHLVSTLREALSSASRLREMGKESFRIVRDEINLSRMAESYVRATASFVR